MNNSREKTLYLRVNKREAQELIDLISKLYPNNKMLNDRYKIMKGRNNIFFPLKINPNQIEHLKQQIKGKLHVKVVKKYGEKRKDYKYKTLEEALEGKIPEKYFDLIPKSYDIIGDIAIVEFNEIEQLGDNERIKKKISMAVIEVNKNVKTVYEKIGKVSGDYRTRELRFLMGFKKSETIHRENNCQFKLDIEKTFFTPRLINERRKISHLKIRKAETIVDLFAGVGPFSIQIAKLHKVKIYAFDKNPHAYEYMKENLQLNDIRGEIFPFNMDVADLINPHNKIGIKLKNKVNRVIMNLPEHALYFLNVACHLINPKGGIIHIYLFSEKPNTIKKAKKKFQEKIEGLNYYIDEISRAKIVKSYSPKSNMIIIDAFVRKNQTHLKGNFK
ncbi:MAG: methyltransferase [Candidatus Lokiarchaeota archaeon]|nr:methyltransferase [Candidatus Lokiarchaeota archaeon]